MQAIFIAYNQAYEELVLRLLERHNLRGYTAWPTVVGRGSNQGEPHMGTHAWPTLNGALITFSRLPAQVEEILSALRKLDEATPKQGLRAFVWDINSSI